MKINIFLKYKKFIRIFFSYLPTYLSDPILIHSYTYL